MPVQVQELSSRITSAVEELWQGMGTLVERIFAKKEKEKQTASVVVAVANTNQQLQTESSTTTSTPSNSLEQSSGGQTTSTVVNNYITNPVIERTVQTVATPDEGYVSESILTTKLSELSDKFSKILYGSTYPAPATNYASGGVMNTIALMGKIDNLDGTNLSSITVDGVSGLVDADIPDGITASNYLLLTGGTLTGSLTGTSLTLSGDLTVSGAQTLSGAITIPYLTATSSTASSFIQASSTRFSIFDKAYFGGTATSSFDSTGALTLATPLLVSSGGTGANTFGQGWIYSSGGTGLLAASTSPTVN